MPSTRMRRIAACVVAASAAVACSSGGGTSAYLVVQDDACACVYEKTSPSGTTCVDVIAKNALAKANIMATCRAVESNCVQGAGLYGFGTKCATATFLGRCEAQVVTTSGEETTNDSVVYADAAGTQLAATKGTCTGTNKIWTEK